MDKNTLSVRELEQKDIAYLADYWCNAEAGYLAGMGVDIEKLPSRKQFTTMLEGQLKLHYEEKKGYALIWEEDGKPIGHSNLNPVTFGDSAFMHLHMWDTATRKKGYGLELVKMSLPYFFDNLQIKKLYCEPYALNPAPNKILEKAGFTFVKEYVTTPGVITFEQPVKRWELAKEDL